MTRKRRSYTPESKQEAASLVMVHAASPFPAWHAILQEFEAKTASDISALIQSGSE